MSGRIRGEYWIADGRVDFADGDVGDQNHEMVALNAVASNYIDALVDYAEELGAEEIPSIDEPFAAASELIRSIQFELLERGFDPIHTSTEIIRRLGINRDVLQMLGGGGDARLHMMKTEGWIAVRSNNVELYGYEQEKRKSLSDGIEEILDQEGIEEPDEEIEFSLYDHKTGRSSDLTLADIKGENQFRPQNLPATTYNKPLWVPPDRTKPMGSQSPRYLDAKTRSLQSASESKMGFRQWLMETCGPLMVRRTWPGLIASEMEPQDRRSSRRTRRSRRR